jgi:hypothetical protein
MVVRRHFPGSPPSAKRRERPPVRTPVRGLAELDNASHKFYST